MSKISIVRLGRQNEVSGYISTKGSGLIKELRKMRRRHGRAALFSL
jgi:hypothetical protein